MRRSSILFPSFAAMTFASAGLLSRWPGSPPLSKLECDKDDGGLVLLEGFCAVEVVSGVGPVRHMIIAPNGDLFAAVSGRGGNGVGGVLAVRDSDGDGKADERESFGPAGGNGIALQGELLYFALNDQVLRYRLKPNSLEPMGDAEVIVRNLPAGRGHIAKTIALGEGNALYVNVGSQTNSCQRTDRLPASPGHDPCTELETRAGIWRFAADRPNQDFRDGTRFATGLRNAMALAIQPGSGALHAVIHGRDQLSDNWGFSDAWNAEKPAEEFVRVEEGDDFGWPYCYYDPQAKRKVLAPEYGGDDGKKIGRCDKKKDPLIGFPGHWAPMALAFYEGTQFPAEYRGGAFIAFHGSWNRSPLPQAGYRVVFAPFANGRPTGSYATFATGVDGPTSLRAAGVAVGPDGSLYISADNPPGRIWRVMKR